MKKRSKIAPSEGRAIREENEDDEENEYRPKTIGLSDRKKAAVRMTKTPTQMRTGLLTLQSNRQTSVETSSS